MPDRSLLSPDRFFSAEPSQRKIARQLYDSVLNLPIIAPCVRLDPRLLTDAMGAHPDPCELLIFSDKQILSRFNAQGINLRNNARKSKRETIPPGEYRKIWQLFVEKLYLIRGNPADILLSEILSSVFGIKEKLASKNAGRIYDSLVDNLKQPDFQLYKLLERFNVETLGIVDSLANPALNVSNPNWAGKLIPCFNADPLFDIQSKEWINIVQQLGDASQSPVTNCVSFIRAIQKQRLHFKSQGATFYLQSFAGSIGNNCSEQEIEAIFQRAIRSEASIEDAHQFSRYMLYEMVSISGEDNLVIQVSLPRNHYSARESNLNDGFVGEVPSYTNQAGFNRFIASFGQDTRPSMILIPDVPHFFSEHRIKFEQFPNLRIGTPDWFFSGLSSMQQYFGQFVENLGVYKTTGMDTSTTSLLALPAQHDIWRRAAANWLANLVVCGLVDIESAYELIYALAYSLVKSAYHLK